MKILLFGGTIEGRLLANELSKAFHLVHVCVATEYGKDVLDEAENVIIHQGRLDENEMIELINQSDFEACIDATHPYAAVVTNNIYSACKKTGLNYYRLFRNEEAVSKAEISDCSAEAFENNNIVYVENIDKAVEYINQNISDLPENRSNILVTTGSKELYKYKNIRNYEEKVYARVLPSVEVVKECEELGIKGKHLICMQGPFSEGLNRELIKACKIGYLVTKNSGNAGGFIEKLESVRKEGIKAIVVERPDTLPDSIKTYNISEIREIFGITIKKQAYIIGAGPGNLQYLSEYARKAIEKSKAIIGSERLIKDFEEITNNKQCYFSYNHENIAKYLETNRPESVALLFSGDIGFYSGADKIDDLLIKQGYEIDRIPGISSAVYLCDKAGISWQNAKFLSVHGRECDYLSYLIKNKLLVILLGKETDSARICKKLCEEGYEDSRVIIGSRLSYLDEKIMDGKAKDFCNVVTDKLSVLIVETY